MRVHRITAESPESRRLRRGRLIQFPQPDEAARYADAVAVGEAEDTWPRILDDARRGQLAPRYVSTRQASLVGMPAPRVSN